VGKFNTGFVQRHGYYPKKKLKRQMLILQGLPGIGRKRAKLLIDRFETIKAVINASEDKLISIGGIGKITANEIINMVNEPKSSYNSTNDFFADI
jgi:DNA excision repair protein ERCC-4